MENREESHETHSNASEGDLRLEDALEPTPEQEEAPVMELYINDDILKRHLERQSRIVKESLEDRLEIPTTVSELSQAYEINLFSPKIPPKNISCSIPLTTPINTPSSFPLSNEYAIANVNNKLGYDPRIAKKGIIELSTIRKIIETKTTIKFKKSNRNYVR